MKKLTSIFLSIIIAAGSAVSNVYAAAADTEDAAGNNSAEVIEQGLADDETYTGLFEKLKTELFDTAQEDDIELKTMDTNTYTEYVYIGSEDDLRAIDGHEGGYYEFARDITLTAGDWKPIKLKNAVVNGKGHWVYGLRQSGDDATGLFAWDVTSTESKDNIYVANLNLSDVSINASGSGETVIAGVLGGYGITAENCYVSGKLSVNPSGAQKVIAIGMGNGINSQARLDITAGGTSEKSLVITGMADCKNCAMEGDISVKGTHRDWEIYGAAYCVNTKVKDYIGDITVSGSVIPGDEYDYPSTYGDSNCMVRALYHCEKTDFTGDIDANVGGASSLGDDLYIMAIAYCKDCNFKGSFDIRSVSVESFSTMLEGICGSDNCHIKGAASIKASGLNSSSAYLIWSSSNSSYDGDLRYDIGKTNFEFKVRGIYDDRPDENMKNNSVRCNVSGSGKSEFTGIVYSDNSTYIGNVDVTGKLLGIGSASNNCVLRGNLHTKGQLRSEGAFSGIYGSCNNCKLYGNISSDSIGDNGRYYYAGAGIYNCTNCSIFGDLTAQYGTLQALSYCKNCYVSGTASTVLSYSVPVDAFKYNTVYRPVFVSSAVPYQGIFRCSECGYEVVSAVNMEGITHCVRARDGYEYKYGKKVEMNYETDSRNDKDSENNYINYVPEPDPVDYTIEVVRIEDGKPLADAKVSVDGDAFITDSDGCCKVKGGRSYEAAVAVEYGDAIVYKNLVFNPMPNVKNTIKVCDFNVEFDAGGSQDAVTEGPKGDLNGTEFSVFDMKSSFNIGLPGKVRVSYDANRKAYRLLFGDLGKINNLEDIADREFEDKYKQIKKFYDQALAGKLDKDEIKAINGKGKRNFAIPAIGSASGFMELQKINKDGKDQIAATGGLIFTAEANMQYSVPFAPCPLVYATYGVSGTVEGGVNLSLTGTNMSDMTISPSARITLMVNPSAGLGLGIKKLASAELGIKGTIRGDLLLPFESLEKSYSAKLSADAYAMLNLLGFDATWSHTFVKWPIFPEVGKVELNPLEAFSEKNMKQTDRGYLANTAQDSREGTIKSNIYPHSKVCCTPTNSGDLMVWLDDDPERADADRTALYYSMKDTNGVWSEPKQVCNDGTADFDFAIYRYAGDVYIVWQNATEKLDGTSVSETAKKIDISMSVLKYRASDWTAPVAITSDNGNYEYSPQVTYTSDGVYIMWLQNDKNSPLPSLDGAKETIYRAFVKRGGTAVDSVEAPLSDTPMVLESMFADGKEIAYIADKDGDPDTNGNIFGTTDSGVLYDNGTDIHSLSCDSSSSGVFYFVDGNKLTKSEGTTSSEIFEADSEIRNISVIGDSNGKAAVYETGNGFGTDIYALYCTQNKWSANPLLIGRFDENVRSWDVFMSYNSSNINLAAVLADIKVKNDYSNSDKELSVDNSITESVRLACLSLEPKQDIAAVYFDTADILARSAMAAFDIGVKNDTMSDISELNVKLTDDKGNALYTGKANAAIAAGEAGIVTIPVQLPDDFTKGSMTAEISVDGLEESNTENNSMTETFGGADMCVDLRGNVTRKTGEISVLAQNIGTVDATDVKVEISDKNGSVIYSENIARIDAGEKVKIKTSVSDELVKSKEAVELTASISCLEDEMYEYNNVSSVVIEPEETHGDVPDESFVYGDADADNVLTASDSACVLQKTLVDSFKMPIQDKTENWLKYTDVDCDNAITASDAAYILQKTLMGSVVMPAEKNEIAQ